MIKISLTPPHSTWAQNIFERIDQDYEIESITTVLLLACFFVFGEWHSLKSLSKKKVTQE